MRAIILHHGEFPVTDPQRAADQFVAFVNCELINDRRTSVRRGFDSLDRAVADTSKPQGEMTDRQLSVSGDEDQ